MISSSPCYLLCAAIMITGCGTSLTQESQIVFMNSELEVEGMRCTPAGIQRFEIDCGSVSINIGILPESNGHAKYILHVLVSAKDGAEPHTETLQAHILSDESSTTSHDVALLTQSTSRDDGLVLVLSKFSISPDLDAFSEGPVSIDIELEYRTSGGTSKTLKLHIPLRRVRITLPTTLANDQSCVLRIPRYSV